MSSGWFVFTIVTSIVICTASILAVAIMRAAWASSQREALTSADLRALEESALLLVEQMRAEADRVLAESAERSAALRELIDEADAKLRALREASASIPSQIIADEQVASQSRQSLDRRRVLELAESGMDCAEIARMTGLQCGEVRLMLGLARVPAS